MDQEMVAISKFKATCLELLKKVKQTGQSLIVTRNGEPIAMVTPVPAAEKPDSWIGSFASSGRITGDILSPVMDDVDWEAMKD
jgi:prevent-host-death family protein